MRKITRLFLWACITVLLVMIGIISLPRSYDVPEWRDRQGTELWDLKTGSNIGIYHVHAESIVKKAPVIYLHGGPGGIIKDAVIEVLSPLASSGHDIYFYDQVGSGHSNRLDDITEYTIERHTDDLQEIVERINANQVILIGHSWGSLLAMEFLKRKADQIQAIILESPGPLLPVRPDLSKLEAPDSLQLRAPMFSNQQGNQEARNLRSILVQKWAYRRGSKLATDREMDEFFTYLNQFLSRSTVCDPGNLKPFPGGGGYYAHIMTFRSLAGVLVEKEMLSNIEIPMLLIRGQCDNQRWGYAHEYLELFSNIKLKIIPDAGHDVISENEAVYFQVVNEFLQSLKE